jgi:hypothetical protein
VVGRARSVLIGWHLLSLDGPTVAACWTWFIARSNHLLLPWANVMAMAAAVWLLYAGDRLLDVRRPDVSEMEERHRFHQRHQARFVAGIAIASVILAVLLPMIPFPAVRLYLVMGGLVFGYFIVIHAMQRAHRLPKEIVVGVCFAAAVFIPTVARRPELRLALLIPALLFAALCSINCLFIYAWEHADGSSAQRPHPVTLVALRHLRALTAFVAVASFVMAAIDRHAPWPIDLAIGLAATALLILNARYRKSDRVALRAAADLSLLTPLLLVAWL